jgi:protein TonB
MAEKIRWQKAVVISLILHGVVLTGVGWLAASALKMPDKKEEYVELDLVNEPDSLFHNADNIDVGSRAANDRQASTAAEIAFANASIVSREIAPSVQAVASNLSVLSVETGGGGSSTGNSSGQEGGGTVSGGAAPGTGKGTGTGTSPGTGSEQGVRHSGGIIAPGILSQVEPDYPEEARQAGVQGTVVLKIQIIENGRAGQVTVYRSSGSSLLDDAAIAVVRKWRFTPARERDSGEAIVCYTKMPVVFKLRS